MELVHLNLSPEDKKEWIDYYKKKKRQLLAELSVVEQNISNLETGDGNVVSKNQIPLTLSNYNGKWQWPNKIVFALKVINRCTTVREIYNTLMEYEPALKNDNSNYLKISSAVSYQSQDDRLLRRYKINELDREFKVGLREWFDVDGSVKPEYRSIDG